MSNSTQIMLGLVVGVFVLVFLVLKTKIHTFLANVIKIRTIQLIVARTVLDFCNTPLS